MEWPRGALTALAPLRVRPRATLTALAPLRSASRLAAGDPRVCPLGARSRKGTARVPEGHKRPSGSGAALAGMAADWRAWTVVELDF